MHITVIISLDITLRNRKR